MPAASLGTLKSGVASRPSTAKRGTVDSVAPEPHCLDLPDVLQSRLPRDGGLSTTTPSEAESASMVCLADGRRRHNDKTCSSRQASHSSPVFEDGGRAVGLRLRIATRRRRKTTVGQNKDSLSHPGMQDSVRPETLPRPAVAITASRSTRRRPARRMKYGTPI